MPKPTDTDNKKLLTSSLDYIDLVVTNLSKDDLIRKSFDKSQETSFLENYFSENNITFDEEITDWDRRAVYSILHDQYNNLLENKSPKESVTEKIDFKNFIKNDVLNHVFSRLKQIKSTKDLNEQLHQLQDKIVLEVNQIEHKIYDPLFENSSHISIANTQNPKLVDRQDYLNMTDSKEEKTFKGGEGQFYIDLDRNLKIITSDKVIGKHNEINNQEKLINALSSQLNLSIEKTKNLIQAHNQRPASLTKHAFAEESPIYNNLKQIGITSISWENITQWQMQNKNNETIQQLTLENIVFKDSEGVVQTLECKARFEYTFNEKKQEWNLNENIAFSGSDEVRKLMVAILNNADFKREEHPVLDTLVKNYQNAATKVLAEDGNKQLLAFYAANHAIVTKRISDVFYHDAENIIKVLNESMPFEENQQKLIENFHILEPLFTRNTDKILPTIERAQTSDVIAHEFYNGGELKQTDYVKHLNAVFSKPKIDFEIAEKIWRKAYPDTPINTDLTSVINNINSFSKIVDLKAPANVEFLKTHFLALQDVIKNNDNEQSAHLLITELNVFLSTLAYEKQGDFINRYKNIIGTNPVFYNALVQRDVDGSNILYRMVDQDNMDLVASDEFTESFISELDENYSKLLKAINVLRAKIQPGDYSADSNAIRNLANNLQTKCREHFINRPYGVGAEKEHVEQCVNTFKKECLQLINKTAVNELSHDGKGIGAWFAAALRAIAKAISDYLPVGNLDKTNKAVETVKPVSSIFKELKAHLKECKEEGVSEGLTEREDEGEGESVQP